MEGQVAPGGLGEPFFVLATSDALPTSDANTQPKQVQPVCLEADTDTVYDPLAFYHVLASDSSIQRKASQCSI